MIIKERLAQVSKELTAVKHMIKDYCKKWKKKLPDRKPLKKGAKYYNEFLKFDADRLFAVFGEEIAAVSAEI